MRRLLGALSFALGLILHSTSAGAVTMTATLTLSSSSYDAVSEGGTALAGQGFFPNGTVITLTSTNGGASGTVDNIPFPSFTASTITYSFTAPAKNSITFTFNSSTGELDFTNSIMTSVTRASTTVALTSPLTLTTETTAGGSPCGGFPSDTFDGDRKDSLGMVTLVGGSCVPASGMFGGPWLTQVLLRGALTQFTAVPEPATASLLGVALACLALHAYRRSC